MNVLVTGCAGFIGSNVTKLLLEDGHMVLGIDNLHGGNDVRLQGWRLDRLTATQGFTFRRLDISEPDTLKSAIRQEHKVSPISVVINLAARAGVRGSVEEPRSLLSNKHTGLPEPPGNVQGARNREVYSCLNV